MTKALVLKVTDRSGETKIIEGKNGQSMMQVIRDSGFGDVAATCGGCCSCATCHVYVEEPFVGKLKTMSQDEDDLLDSFDNRRVGSRLSCQVILDEGLDGLCVTVAPQD